MREVPGFVFHPSGTRIMPTTLMQKTCTPCEGGAGPMTAEAARALLPEVAGWSIAPDGRSLRREWTARSFAEGAEFFHEVAILAESEGHHPDFHLTTHAVGGLTENDFILAAKINAIPFETRPGGSPGH